MFSTPRLSLPEIAADYPRLELLESGHIQDWLSTRAAQLSDRAHVNSNWADWLKLTSIVTGGLTAGLALSTPLAPAILLLSLTSYIAAVGEDREITREVYPIPWVRMNLLKILRSVMENEYREKEEFIEKYTIITLTDGTQSTIDRPAIRIEKERLFTYLSLEDRSEAAMLMDNLTARKMGKPEISAILAECHSNNRFLLYRLILREYQDYGNLALTPEQIQYLYREINDSYQLDQRQIDRFSNNPISVPPRSIPHAAPVIPPIPVAPPDDRPHQSRRVKEPSVDWEINLDRLREKPIAPAPMVHSLGVSPTIPTAPKATPRETGIEKILANPFESRAFFGAQRTGKSYLVACTSQRLAEKGIKIFHINLASLPNGDDTRYWPHARSVRADLPMLDPGEARVVVGDALKLVKEFREAPRGAILICDEWTIMGGVLHSYAEYIEPLTKLLGDTVTSFKSSGIQRQKAVWTIAPDIIAGGLTDTAKMAVKNLSLVLVAIPPWETVTWQAEEGGLINTVSFSPGLYGQLKKNYTGLVPPVHNSFLAGSDRIVFTDGHWYPVGVDKHSLKSSIKAIAFNPPDPQPDPISQEFTQLTSKQ
jgi:hypothetical protein